MLSLDTACSVWADFQQIFKCGHSTGLQASYACEHCVCSDVRANLTLKPHVSHVHDSRPSGLADLENRWSTSPGKCLSVTRFCARTPSKAVRSLAGLPSRGCRYRWKFSSPPTSCRYMMYWESSVQLNCLNPICTVLGMRISLYCWCTQALR